MKKYTCEKCSMEGEYTKNDELGMPHYFCEHHKLEGSIRVVASLNEFKEVPTKENRLRKFLPLVLIFLAILVFTLTSGILHGPFDMIFSMRMMMGSFFAIFGLFKVFNLRAFADAYRTYDILAMRSRVYTFMYPFLELLLAVLYISNTGGVSRDVFTFLLMTVSATGVLIKIRQKKEVPCACLGMVFKIPMSYVTLIEDLLMALEALITILVLIK